MHACYSAIERLCFAAVESPYIWIVKGGDECGIKNGELLYSMATYLGKIGEFDSMSETWPNYIEQLEHFFSANKVEDNQKKDAFSMCGQGNVRLAMSPGRTDKTEGLNVWRTGGNAKGPLSTKTARYFRKVPVLQEGPKGDGGY